MLLAPPWVIKASQSGKSSIWLTHVRMTTLLGGEGKPSRASLALVPRKDRNKFGVLLCNLEAHFVHHLAKLFACVFCDAPSALRSHIVLYRSCTQRHAPHALGGN